MKNAAFLELLHGPRVYDPAVRKGSAGKPVWTIARLAEDIGSGRAHLNQVLTNARKGTHTRKKVVRWLRREFPQDAAAMVGLLGWAAETEDGGSRMVDGGNTSPPAPLPIAQKQRRGEGGFEPVRTPVVKRFGRGIQYWGGPIARPE